MPNFNFSYEVAQANGFGDLYNEIASKNGNKNGKIDNAEELSIFVMGVREKFKDADDHEFENIMAEKFGIYAPNGVTTKFKEEHILIYKETIINRIGYEITKLFKGEDEAIKKYYKPHSWFELDVPYAEMIDKEA